MNLRDSDCGDVKRSMEFSLEEFASCPRPFTVLAIDPQTMQAGVVATGPANKAFSNITIGLTLGEELWVGSFGSDRIAWRTLQPADE